MHNSGGLFGGCFSGGRRRRKKSARSDFGVIWGLHWGAIFGPFCRFRRAAIDLIFGIRKKGNGEAGVQGLPDMCMSISTETENVVFGFSQTPLFAAHKSAPGAGAVNFYEQCEELCGPSVPILGANWEAIFGNFRTFWPSAF